VIGNLDIKCFKLNENFLKNYKGKQPEWGPLGYFTYKRTYARHIHGKDRKEEYWETVKRVVEGCFSIQKNHCQDLKLPWNEQKAIKSAQRMYEKIWNFKFTPPGRGFWIMGTDFISEHGSMALNNCGFVSTNDIEVKYSQAFEFLMHSLMVGVGVGFDTRGAGKLFIKQPKKEKFKFTIPDSREGWVKALKKLLKAYFLGEKQPDFDYSKIRPKGEPLKSFGGTASGPEPLKNMLNDIDIILNGRIGEAINSLDILDIMNLIGKCVVAGGVRRSAEIGLGKPDDKEFIKAKQNQKKLRSHRWVSNNSIIAEKGMDYSFISKQIAKNGEPGLFWLENAQKYSRMIDPPDNKDKNALGMNPCGEQTLESFELCCLAETYPSRHQNWEEFKETLKYAYIYAKTVTLVNTQVKVTNAVMLKNRRMGISQTGIIEAFSRHGKHKMIEWCKKGYEYLKKLDEKYSDWLCIPKSIKITTVKPSGTVSILPGVSHGIHFPHSKYYIRRIRIQEGSELIKLAKEAGYNVIKDKYSENTMIIEFPVKKQYFTRGKGDVSIWEQAENAALYQKYWSDNQVSITVSFKDEEKKDLRYLLQSYEDKLKAISFLPLEEHGYEQAPYEEISEEEYKRLSDYLKPLYLEKVKEKARGQIFCDSEECEIHINKNQ
jgi:adenosylcobalamin-dependent ribonucleoside-triphosphate reductase